VRGLTVGTADEGPHPVVEDHSNDLLGARAPGVFRPPADDPQRLTVDSARHVGLLHCESHPADKVATHGVVVTVGGKDADTVLGLGRRRIERLGAGEGQRVIEHPLIGLVRPGLEDQQEKRPETEVHEGETGSHGDPVQPPPDAWKLHAPSFTRARKAGLRLEQMGS